MIDRSKYIVQIWTDGSCDNSKKDRPGAREGGYGIVMQCRGIRKEYSSDCFTNTTSSRMEMMAVIEALNRISTDEKWLIEIFSDSQYVVNTFSEWIWSWKRKGILEQRANSDLLKKFLKVYRTFSGRQRIKFHWVKGHAGTELNEIADNLANKGRKSKIKKEDKR